MPNLDESERGHWHAHRPSVRRPRLHYEKRKRGKRERASVRSQPLGERPQKRGMPTEDRRILNQDSDLEIHNCDFGSLCIPIKSSAFKLFIQESEDNKTQKSLRLNLRG